MNLESAVAAIAGLGRQLVERRLWPVALLLIAAAIGAPMFLASDPEAEQAAAVAAVPPASHEQPGPLEEAALVALAPKSTEQSRVIGASRDPFSHTGPQPAPTPDASAEVASTGTSAGLSDTIGGPISESASSIDSTSKSGGGYDLGSSAGSSTGSAYPAVPVPDSPAGSTEPFPTPVPSTGVTPEPTTDTDETVTPEATPSEGVDGAGPATPASARRSAVVRFSDAAGVSAVPEMVIDGAVDTSDDNAVDPDSTTPAPVDAVGLKRLASLPGADDPALVYLGVEEDLESAVFLLGPGVTTTGDGTCMPTPESCTSISLKAGESVTVNVPASDGSVTTYRLELTRIAETKATTARKAEMSRLAVAPGGRAAVRSLASRLGGIVYDARTGLLRHMTDREWAAVVARF